MRVLWFSGGLLSLGLGALGVLLPLLPTVPFAILAAFCFSRSSDRLHDWLVRHPAFGPAIRDWRAHGAISRRGKRAATASVTVAFGISVWMAVPAWAMATQAVALAGVMLFVWTRPEGPAPEGEDAPGPLGA